MLVVGQTLIHTAFTAMAGHADTVTHAPHPESTVGSASHFTAAAPGTLADALGMNALMSAAPTQNDPVADAVGHLVADFSGANAAMALTHIVAAAAVGLWLAAGERLLWSLISLLTAPVVRGLRLTRTFVVTSTVDSAAASRRIPRGARIDVIELPVTRLLKSSAVIRRGPPVWQCA